MASTLQDTNKALQEQLAALQEQANSALASVQPPKGQDGRIAPLRQSRIVDRPKKADEKDSTLKIRIELDLEVEVDLYARVKGDVTIGLL